MDQRKGEKEEKWEEVTEFRPDLRLPLVYFVKEDQQVMVN